MEIPVKLGEVLRRWRRVSDLNVRDAAKEIGLSAPTLSRIERGEAMDGNTLAVIIRWLLSSETGKKKP